MVDEITVDHKQAIKSARQTFIEENYKKTMEDNYNVLVAIRDDKTTSSRDKIEASKLLARMVSGLQPERSTTVSSESTSVQQTMKLSKADMDRIKKIAQLDRSG